MEVPRRMLQAKIFVLNDEIIAATDAFFKEKEIYFYYKDVETLENRWQDCVTLLKNESKFDLQVIDYRVSRLFHFSKLYKNVYPEISFNNKNYLRLVAHLIYLVVSQRGTM